MRRVRRWGPGLVALAGIVAIGGCCASGGTTPTTALRLASSDPRQEPNGFLFNPIWREVIDPHVLNAGGCKDLKDCGDPEVAGPPGWTEVMPFLCKDTGGGPRNGKPAGHLLFGTGTFWGKLDFDVLSPDDDFNFDFWADAGRLGMWANQDASNAHLEVRFGETFRHFRSAGWDAFRNASAKKQRELIHGRRAVVLATIALDCVHCYAVELHPVFALAVRTSVKELPDGVEETWLLFARPIAGGGECSAFASQLRDLDRLVLPLPWPEKLPDVGVELVAGGTGMYGTNAAFDGTEVVVVTPEKRNRWVTVSLPLHLSADVAIKSWTRVSGDLVLRYRRGGSATAPSAFVSPVVAPSVESRAPEKETFEKGLATGKESREEIKKGLAKLAKTDPEKYRTAVAVLYHEDSSWYDTPHDTVPLHVALVPEPAGGEPQLFSATSAPPAAAVAPPAVSVAPPAAAVAPPAAAVAPPTAAAAPAPAAAAPPPTRRRPKVTKVPMAYPAMKKE